MTKRETRAATLAALAPLPGQLLWDVGAGCGSVAIEWMRAGGRAIAIENNPDRLAMAARNAALLGVPELELIKRRGPGGAGRTGGAGRGFHRRRDRDGGFVRGLLGGAEPAGGAGRQHGNDRGRSSAGRAVARSMAATS